MEDTLRVPSVRPRSRINRSSPRRNCLTFPNSDTSNLSDDSQNTRSEDNMSDSDHSLLDEYEAKDVVRRPGSGSKQNSHARISRMNTCSIDLSDITFHPRHTEDLYNIEDPHSHRVSRTGSFTSGDMPKLFHIEDFDECEVLGSGAFGRAVKMRHKRNGQFCVVKELLEHRKASEENLLQEISVLRNLNHPNVLRCYGVVIRDKSLGIVTEFIEGGSLHSAIHVSGAELQWPKRLHYARDIANGMLYLHRKSIIHRDLNSHNCFLRKTDSVVVADFGLAKIVTELCPDSSTDSNKGHHAQRRKHTVVGNPYWMAPEMLANGTYGLSADVYSFGIILCELIAGVDTDPNFLPRFIGNLSLDLEAYKKMVLEKFENNPPPRAFLDVNLECCRSNPDERPDFSTCLSSLEQLCVRTG